MYLKFKKDAYFNGKVYKEDVVYYVTNYQRFIDSGEAEEVDYAKHHEDNLKNKVIDVKPADGQPAGNPVTNTSND